MIDPPKLPPINFNLEGREAAQKFLGPLAWGVFFSPHDMPECKSEFPPYICFSRSAQQAYKALVEPRSEV